MKHATRVRKIGGSGWSRSSCLGGDPQAFLPRPLLYGSVPLQKGLHLISGLSGEWSGKGVWAAFQGLEVRFQVSELSPPRPGARALNC